MPNALVQLQAHYHHCGEAASDECLSAATSLAGVRESVYDRAGSECQLRREMSPNSLDNLLAGWHDAERSESSTLDDGRIIHEHFVFALKAVLHRDIDQRVTSRFGRHTGGVRPSSQSAQQRTTTLPIRTPSQ